MSQPGACTRSSGKVMEALVRADFAFPGASQRGGAAFLDTMCTTLSMYSRTPGVQLCDAATSRSPRLSDIGACGA